MSNGYLSWIQLYYGDTIQQMNIWALNLAVSNQGVFLTSYLYGSNNTTALLSKKALEYNSYRHKYHKRLIRYLTWQWRIRQIYSTLKRPYSIGGDKGLLAVMAIPLTWKPSRIREHLENVLTDLEKRERNF